MRLKLNRGERQEIKQSARGVRLKDAIADSPVFDCDFDAVPRDGGGWTWAKDWADLIRAEILRQRAIRSDTDERIALARIAVATKRARQRAYRQDGGQHRPTSAAGRRAAAREAKRVGRAFREGRLRLGPIVQRSLYAPADVAVVHAFAQADLAAPDLGSVVKLIAPLNPMWGTKDP